MQKEYKVLGIDLGGCMSGNSAYVYAMVSADKIEVFDSFKEPRHKDHIACQRFLCDALSRHEIDAVAIDAPLSIPKPLTDPAFQSPPREGSGEILNPYLYRYTDYFLYREFGLRPMPPAGDRIGRLTARAAALLNQNGYRFPHITLGDRKIPLYEVYPKQIAQHLGLTAYKHEPGLLFQRLKTDLHAFDEHLLDALLCVYGGYKVLRGETLYPPEGVTQEGWCFPAV